MDHERNEMDKMDEVMLPGFRFHPTDEELVGFYLKRKIQQRPLSIELIKQLDIYKYDPWDLPKLATTGEKEWYFYCPRDRKYRNSARPNRVTGAGFWKATGTDRPIYSSEGNKCIGLKKSLVFYKGRAAKGIKTDWMMHEFRLPSLTDSSLPPKRFLDKTNIPASDSWAICRIFKKTNSTAQRALSQSWVSPLPEPTSSDHHILAKGSQTSGFIPHDISLITETSSAIQLNYNNNGHVQHPSTTTATTNFSSQPLDFPYYRPLNSLMLSKPTSHHQVPPTSGTLMFSPLETLAPTKCTSSVVDVSSIFLNMSSSMLGDFGKASNDCIDFGASQQDHCNGLSFCSSNNFQQTMQGMSVVTHEDQNVSLKNINMSDTDDHQWPETVRNSNIGLAFNLPANMVGSDAWRPNLIWESSSSPSDVSSTSFSTTKCYT